MPAPLLVAKNAKIDLHLLPALANRHGLITGATGTGKTVTLQAIAQQLSSIGVPVFMADVKGDLAGLAKAGGGNPKVEERAKLLKLDLRYEACPVIFWDVFGAGGHPVRATVSDMGPLLLSRLLGLNDTQEGVLNLVFKIADDNGLLLLDAKDLRAMLQHVGENASQFTTEYGNVSAASIGAIQRGVLALESQGADRFFGEPMLDIADLMQVDQGKGVVNILAADKLFNSPKVYSTFLLWMLAGLTLPYSVWNWAALSPMCCSIARRSLRSSSSRPLSSAILKTSCNTPCWISLRSSIRAISSGPMSLTVARTGWPCADFSSA